MPKAHYFAGQADILWEHWSDAAAEFTGELALVPADPDAKFNLGFVALQQSKTEEAAELFRQILVLHPDHAKTQYELGKMLLDRGQVKEAIEHLEAAARLSPQADYVHYQLQAAYLALTANIVTAAVKEASLRAQIEATERIASDEADQLGVLGQQFDLGGVSRTAVLAQQTLLAQTRATLPPLRQSLDQVRHQLAVLAGMLPSDPTLPEFRLDMFSLPETLPVSLPSALVRQRPDILAADAVLHQASAQIGVATAALYPQITLSASYGAEALAPSQVFKPGSTIWSLGAGLLQPVFHGGQLSAQKRAAEAAYEQAGAQYRETVLLAFQNVADSLRALDHDATGLRAQTDAWRAASDSLDLTRGQYRVGGVSYLSLLDAQRQYQQTVTSLAQAQASRYADTAALFQALGGGWWNAPPSAPPPH